MRSVRIAPSDTVVRHGDDGVIYMESPYPLGAYAEKLTERLEHWASVAPDRTYLAERDATSAPHASRPRSGGWRRVSYGEALGAVRSLAQAILDRHLSPERPIVILSGNSIDHALLALGVHVRGCALRASRAGLFAAGA